jgi:hypothetical protein
MTDRGFGVAGLEVGGNVRRLMYQSLIWPFHLRHDPGSLGTPLHAENGERLADALVDGVVRDAELGRDLLRAQMLVDEKETVELSRAESGDTLGHVVDRRRDRDIARRIVRTVRIVQGNPHRAKHLGPSRAESLSSLWHMNGFSQFAGRVRAIPALTKVSTASGEAARLFVRSGG